MDRTRESRRSSPASMTMSSITNGFPRRRNLRDASEEGLGPVELQETVRLRPVTSKRGRDRDGDRDRDSSNRNNNNNSNSNKRRRGSHALRDEHGDNHTAEEESVGNEQYDDVLQDAALSRMRSPNTVSDQNHRRSFPPPPPPPQHPPLKITDEMIGVTVPRKTRSASVKRSHESWVSASGSGGEEQNFRQRSNSPAATQSVEAASPSSSNVSAQKKKMKAIGPISKTSKSCSSAQEDIEIEIAELLYGLSHSKNHKSSSQKLEANARSTSPSSYPSTDVEKKKVEDYNSESEQPGNAEALLPDSAKVSGCHDDNAIVCENGSSEAPKEETEEGNLNSGAGCGVTEDGTGESPSFSKLDVDKHDTASTRAMSAVPEANNSQGVGKFEIDLMAPPPMMLSPEGDHLSRGDFTSETKALALDMETKREDSIRVEDKMERLVKKEKTTEEIDEAKMDAFKEKRDELKLDLEKPNNDNDIRTNNKLEEQGRSKEQANKSSNPEVEKMAQTSSVPLSTAVPGWPTSHCPLGHMPPLQTFVKTDKATGSLSAPQHMNFVLSQLQPKRCATHYYIARSISHQQFTKMPAAVGPGSLCGAKPDDVNCVSSAESMVVGKQSQKHLPSVNQNAAQEKGKADTTDPILTANKSSNNANSMDSTQRMQLVLQQGPHLGSTGNRVHGPAFLLPPGQHQASVTAATSQAVAVNSTSSASSSNKIHGSASGSLGTSSTLPAVAAAMSFGYPNFPATDAPYVTIVQNNGYSFPFSTSLGATAPTIGASPAQATHMLNGPFYASQMFLPLQCPQQHPHSQALVQPSYLNASTSSSSSSSHKQSQGAQVNGNNILTSPTMQVQQSQKQQTSLSHPRKQESDMGGEKAPSVANRTSYPQKNVYGQNFTIPVQPVNLSFRPSATSDIFVGKGGNFGDMQQQQQGLKGGVELIPSQPFAISFAGFNGTSAPSNLNFSSMAHSPMVFHSLPDITWQGYQAASTSHTNQQKAYSNTDGKSGGGSSHRDDEKKTTPGKSSTNGPTTLVFDNSSKNLNFVLSPTSGNWPSHSIASTAITSVSLSSNALSSQQPPQLLQLQKQHGMQQQQPAMATGYKASLSTNSGAPTKFVNNAPVFSQNPTQCKSSNQVSHSKSSGRTTDSQVHHVASTTPTLTSFPQEQGRVIQGQTQISFGGNYISSSLPPQGQQLLNNNQPLYATVAGTSPTGGNLKPNSQGRKASSSMNTSQMQQTENSSSGSGQKSSPVCGRNVPSILSSCPGHLSELKY